MSDLEAILIGLLRKIGRTVTRTELVKILFLFECTYYKLYGRSFTGVQFVRHNYGPHCEEVIQAAHRLERAGLVNTWHTPNYFGGLTYYYCLTDAGARPATKVAPEEERLITYIAGLTKPLSLELTKRIAYSMPPMMEILREEAVAGYKVIGRRLNMDKMRPSVEKKPISRLKKAFAEIDLAPRGTDQEYSETILNEWRELQPYRQKAEQCKA
ncbi:MAG: type II toxin-antitoxin system antitoxin SocA domain-containing protein [Ignavibacteriales bacterium]